MQFRIQRGLCARISALAIVTAALAFHPGALRAGGEDPPHGRPDVGGDVALRRGSRGSGESVVRGMREGRRGAGALDALEAAIGRLLDAAPVR